MSKLTGIIFSTQVFSNALYDYYLFSAERLHCPDCNKTFKSKTSLENHKSVHKPSSHYQVKISYKLVYSHYLHFQCLSCPMFYLSREELLEHLRGSGHSKGVFSTSGRGPEVPFLIFRLQFILFLRFLWSKRPLPFLLWRKKRRNAPRGLFRFD